MPDVIIDAIALVVVGILSYFGGRHLPQGQRNAVDVRSLIDLSNEVRSLGSDLSTMRNRVDDFEDKNRLLWNYVYALIENDHKNGVMPALPPTELLADEKLKELLLKRIKEDLPQE